MHLLFLRFLRSLQIHTPFLLVKRLFLAVVFSAQTALKTPKIQALLS
ncbi:hypothetical protein N409_08030 [Helicobacter pylori FD719]|nr:hypothetical protein N409_08030 [Helicobacter pylori FD719]